MKFFFVPGRKWLVSQAEIRSVLRAMNWQYVELSGDDQVLLFDIQKSTDDVRIVFERLGGFVKCGTIVEDPFDFLRNEFVGSEPVKTSKIPFSISFHVSKPERRLAGDRMQLGMEIKRWLTEHGFRARFVSKKSQLVTSAVLLQQSHVLENGFELNRFIHPKNKNPLWGITLRIQDFAEFSKRDYGRPCANKEKGMLPPKLARMMVNLAEVPVGGVVWDPCCGSGTVLMEALTMGYSVIGSDVDGTSIHETETNLKWVCDQYWISHQKYLVFKHDIRDGIPDRIVYDAIVTEPYLGPVLKRLTTVNQVEDIVHDLTPVYRSLDTLATVASKDSHKVRMVVVVPSFKTSQGWIEADVGINDLKRWKNITSSVAEMPLQWDRPHSIIRRNLKVFSSV